MTIDLATATKLLAYLDRVLEINQTLNLTAVRDREDAIVRHILDSLTLVPVWREVTGRDAPKWFLDLGTGGGFPGAVLAAVWPKSRALLIDSTGKKVRAVDDALKVSGIARASAPSVETLHARGVEVPSQVPRARRGIDLCVARAVGPAFGLVREMAPLLAPGGVILLMKGPEPPAEEIAAGEREATDRGLVTLPIRTTRVEGLETRTVLVYRRG
ncbi:MAG: class I SAM-dependent methyltransferase [Planctomycetes bacterium]|nr:class I SAM-dependent methyltransferase [Planctomycetota bacterium]